MILDKSFLNLLKKGYKRTNQLISVFIFDFRSTVYNFTDSSQQEIQRHCRQFCFSHVFFQCMACSDFRHKLELYKHRWTGTRHTGEVGISRYKFFVFFSVHILFRDLLRNLFNHFKQCDWLNNRNLSSSSPRQVYHLHKLEVEQYYYIYLCAYVSIG